MVNKVGCVGAVGLGLAILGIIARFCELFHFNFEQQQHQHCNQSYQKRLAIFPPIYKRAIEKNMRLDDEKSPGYRQ